MKLFDTHKHGNMYLLSILIKSILLRFPAEYRRIDALLKNLSLIILWQTSQKEKTTVSDLRALFVSAIESFSDSTIKLTSSATIVHCPESEIV